jgi:predicted HicB family RNase H-like nuclease
MASYVRPTGVISVRMPLPLRQKIAAQAASAGKSINAFALEKLEQAMRHDA